MSEEIMQPSADHVGQNVFTIEYNNTIRTDEHRRAVKVSDFGIISLYKSMFSSVELLSLEVEIRQNALLETHLEPGGHIFVAVIPTVKNSEALSGQGPAIVTGVPNKQTFPLSGSEQSHRTYKLPLAGFELDLAVDPRRGAGPVAWMGNSGLRPVDGGDETIVCSATWKATVRCSGTSPLWV